MSQYLNDPARLRALVQPDRVHRNVYLDREGLAAEGNEWVSLHRNCVDTEAEGLVGRHNGTSEIAMRGQFRAWAKAMYADEEDV